MSKKTTSKLGLSTTRVMVVIVAIAAMTFLMSGTALANWGPHGGYGVFTIGADTNGNGVIDTGELVDPDTDACAGCHRAHTAVSQVTWTETGNPGGNLTKNALLIGTTATTLKEFCYTCHADSGIGASTNVQSGVFDTLGTNGGPTGVGYGTTESTESGILNGGGFMSLGATASSVTSAHTIDGAGGIAYGGGADGIPNAGPGTAISVMDCAACHDPHGSSNYRILKDTVNGVTVGGYTDLANAVDPTPNPYVISNEVGYPIYTDTLPVPTGPPGFRLHRNYGDLDGDGITEAGDYQPNYTEAMYARSNSTAKGLSGWCAACHTTYNTTSSSGQLEYNADGYDPAIGYGDVVRHRHPVNVALSTFYGDRHLIVDNLSAANTPWGDQTWIPLEHDAFNTLDRAANQTNTIHDNDGTVGLTSDWMGCLTCHRAHGTNAIMDGYADSSSNTLPNRDYNGQDSPVYLNADGVPPANSSALLRADNRGVCERCHNK
ncbi:MAG: cytochrome c3 family protein [Actinomycetota bacterium]